MDSWYATQRLMALIDNLGKIYYFPLKSNRLVDKGWGCKKISKTGRIKMEWVGISAIERLLRLKEFQWDQKVRSHRG